MSGRRTRRDISYFQGGRPVRKRPKRNPVSRPTAPTPEESLSPASEPTPVPILDGRITLVGEAARLIKRPEAAATLAALEHVGEILRAAKPTPGPDGSIAIAANLQGLPIAWSVKQILAAKKKADRGGPVKWDVKDRHTCRNPRRHR
jgi:hypothetical protein